MTSRDEHHRRLDDRRQHIVRIEPHDRIVVLARAIETTTSRAARQLETNAANWGRLGSTCLGQALYRHHSVIGESTETPAWNHLELSYFSGFIPVHAIAELTTAAQTAGSRVMRAEVLVTTPSSFIMPRTWRGSIDRPELRVSLEYLDVHPTRLDDYRSAMREYCGPAAAHLVGVGRFGTFRAMETAAVLHTDPALDTTWNQIHLCELQPDEFHGFGQEFASALANSSPNGGSRADVFDALPAMRDIAGWTLNEPIVEADVSLSGVPHTEPSSLDRD